MTPDPAARFSEVAIPDGARGPLPATAAVLADLLAELPAGQMSLWGVPFALAPASATTRWAWVDPNAPEDARAVSLPIGRPAGYLVVAHFAVPAAPDPEPKPASRSRLARLGEHLADYILRYDDGSEHRVEIRRQFEVGDVNGWDLAFAARPQEPILALDWRGPYWEGRWGDSQQGALGWEPWLTELIPFRRDVRQTPRYWLLALESTAPHLAIAELRLEACGGSAIGIGAVTAYRGRGDPLRHRRLETVLVEPPRGAPPADQRARVDLGVIARQWPVTPFDGDEWLGAAETGWGEPPRPSDDTARTSATSHFVELSAADGAVIAVGDERVALAEVRAHGSATSEGGLRVRAVTGDRQWVTVTIVDEATGRPTPARVAFRAPDGRYLPPHGHRREVNPRWFEDYGADLQLGATSYAYVDGRFAIELPVGDVYAEVVKGFEYEPARSRLDVRPGMRELRLPIARAMDWRSRGWVAADTHVHFLSPQTAWLEAQAEGVNVVNLLASQWGDLFTNIADFTGQASGASRDDTVVWVGTENRQHLLGHLSLLGIGQLVTPLAAGGPSESFIGDPVWTGLTEWADQCREQGGLVVSPHFPAPYGEVVAAVVLGKIDAVELRDYAGGVASFGVQEWYRLLDCGYRVAAVGGTDKMSAAMPLGGVRTYAHIGEAELTFASWAAAVRAGRTSSSSGPLVTLAVEGRSVGDAIELPPGGGTLAVEAHAEALRPLASLEVIMNSKVVARVEGGSGERRLRLRTDVQAGGPGWIAARCEGPDVLWHEWPVQTAAHTSPIYLVGRGRPPATDADRAYLLTLLDGGLAWLDHLAIPAEPDRHEHIRARFAEARVRLETGLGGGAGP